MFSDLARDYADFYRRLDAIIDDHCPGSVWRRAERASRADLPRSRAWKARFLDLNPEPLHNAIALAGMVPLMWEDTWHLAVALPQPEPLGLPNPEVDDVILIARDGTAQMLGDRECAYFAPRRRQERIRITRDAKQWARDIALQRLEWWRLRGDRRRKLHAEPTWCGEPEGGLIMGPLKRVRWSDFDATVIEVPADLRQEINRAVYAQARLPRVEGRA
jgi:hypothetical protein